jgi:hypothetical protein
MYLLHHNLFCPLELLCLSDYFPSRVSVVVLQPHKNIKKTNIIATRYKHSPIDSWEVKGCRSSDNPLVIAIQHQYIKQSINASRLVFGNGLVNTSAKFRDVCTYATLIMPDAIASRHL